MTNVQGPGSVLADRPLGLPGLQVTAAGRTAPTFALARAEIVQQMGSKPRAELRIFGHVFKVNSIAYKEVLREVDTLQQQMKEHDERPDLQRIQPMMDTLGRVIAATEHYEQQHRLNPLKGARRRVMQDIAQLARSRMAELENSQAARFAKNPRLTIPGPALRQMVDQGLTDAYPYSPAPVPADSPRFETGGGVNRVVRVRLSGEEQDRYLKPVGGVGFAALPVYAKKLLGLDSDSRLGFIQRNVATSAFAAALGRPQLAPMPTVVVDEGQIHIATPAAPGEPLCRPQEVVIDGHRLEEELEFSGEDAFQSTLDMFAEAGTPIRKEGVQWLQLHLHAVSFPFTADGEASRQCASLQEGLCAKQTLDALVGQVDAHGANIFVELGADSVKVTGIDHDFCFPEQPGLLDPLLPPQEKEHYYLGMPPLLPRDTYVHLLQLTEAHVDTYMDNGFSEPAKRATKERLTRMQGRAREMEGQGLVVDDFATWTKQLDGLTYTASTYLTRADAPPNLVRWGAEGLAPPHYTCPPEAERHRIKSSAHAVRQSA